MAGAVGAAGRIERVRGLLSAASRGTRPPGRCRRPRCRPRRTCSAALLASVGAEDGFAADAGDAAWVALRVRYRQLLAAIAAYDLLSASPVDELAVVAARLADAAGAALEASLCVARSRVSGGGAGAGLFPREQVAATRLAIIGMGKTGARELNYVSDVDVIFVAGADEAVIEDVGESRIVDIATRLAVQTMRGIYGVEIEPPLWEVDANLRPEGKQGALVRTLDSHLSYYDRWAKSWEFQALLKARPIAGDAELGDAYVRAVQPKIWTSAARENFVDSVQRMRERVTEHIPAAEVPYQLKLGPGRHPRHRVHRAAAPARARALAMTASASAARSTRSTRSSSRATSAAPRRRRSRTTTGCFVCSSIACSCATCAART